MAIAGMDPVYRSMVQTQVLASAGSAAMAPPASAAASQEGGRPGPTSQAVGAASPYLSLQPAPAGEGSAPSGSSTNGQSHQHGTGARRLHAHQHSGGRGGSHRLDVRL